MLFLSSETLCFRLEPRKTWEKKYVDRRAVYEFSNSFTLYYFAVHRGLNFSSFLSLIIYDLFNFNFGYHSRTKEKIYEKRKKVLAA